MAKWVLGVVAIWFAGLAAVMLFTPHWWYAATPGVPLTGPFNGHFVFDIGLAFAVSAGVLLCGLRRGDAALCLAGLGWPMAHALYHLWLIWAQASCAEGELAANLAGIQAPAWGGVLAVAFMKFGQRKGEMQ